MTCIVGLKHEGDIYLGGERAAVDDAFALYLGSGPKVFIKESDGDQFAIGVCGDGRLSDILQYVLEFPRYHPSDPVEKYIAVDFAIAMRACLKESGDLVKVDERECFPAGNFLFGFRGEIYYIFDNYQFNVTQEEYSAVGSGSRYALGSLHTTKGLDMGPEERVRKALEAACRHNQGCEPPIDIIHLPAKTTELRLPADLKE